MRAVTPRVPAAHSIVHRHDCTGDCCNYDAVGDEFVTGDPTNPNWPDMPLRLKPSRNVGARLSPPARAGQPSPPLG